MVEGSVACHGNTFIVQNWNGAAYEVFQKGKLLFVFSLQLFTVRCTDKYMRPPAETEAVTVCRADGWQGS